MAATKDNLWQIKTTDYQTTWPALIMWILPALIAICAAPQFFRRNDEIGFSTVYRQPSTPEEIANAEEARLGCPTESIGKDGEEP